MRGVFSLLDLIDNKVFRNGSTVEQQLMGAFVGMGAATTLISSGMSFWYFANSKERVMQSIKSPSVILRDGSGKVKG